MTLFLLAAITAVGLAVRANGLTDYGTWFDEAYHVQLVKLPSVADMLGAVLANPPSDPLYVLLLRPWTWLFGTGDAAVRSLSVIFSTATIPVTYWLGRAIAGPAIGKATGLFGALLLALSPYAVQFGQEAALYALASLATTAALAAGWQWWVTGRGGWPYVALGIVAIYSHYVVAVILLLFALLMLLARRIYSPGNASGNMADNRTWLLVHALIFAAWSPWLIALIMNWGASSVPRATLSHYATLDEVGGALVQFTTGSASLLQGQSALQFTGLACGAILLIFGWLAGNSVERSGLRVLVVVAATIFLAPAAISAATGLWLFVPHFMLFLLPALFVVCGSGVAWTWVSSRSRVQDSKLQEVTEQPGTWNVESGTPRAILRYGSVVLFAVWVGAQAWGLGLFYRYPPHGVDGLRELSVTIREGALPGDLVAVMPPVLAPTLAQYYPGEIRGLPSDFDLRAVYLAYEPETWRDESISRLSNLMQGRSRLWLVYWPGPELDVGGALLSFVQGRYQVALEREYPYAKLYLFQAR